MSTTELRAHSTVVELGACLIVLLPGAALIDLREMEEASSLFESLERIRDALSERAPAPTQQVWVASSERLAALDDEQFSRLTQALYDCFGASRSQVLMFDRPEPDPAVSYLLSSLGMQVLPPGSIEIAAAGSGLTKLEVLSLLDSFRSAGGGQGAS